MNKLNRIFYGSAGTGKTRESMKTAIEIVNKKLEEEGNFKSLSNLAQLPDGINNVELIQKIQDDSIKIDDIVNDDSNEGQLKYFSNGVFEKAKAKDCIKEYRETNNKYPYIEIVTFHPSYSYQDFVEGISAETTKDNQIIYKSKDGIFKKLCDRAISNKDNNYVLIIDEINRGDISSIFGELFTLLEDSKRLGESEELSINLPYSKDDKGNPKKLTIPSNLYILATMNTIDKSIALIDIALRRRFEFIECKTQYNLDELKSYKEVDLPKLLKVMNQRIIRLKNENYQIGHSYFLDIDNLKSLNNIISKQIVPLLQEYFYDDWKSICAVLNQDYENNDGTQLLIIYEENDNLFKEEFSELIEFTNKKFFNINHDITVKMIKSIYE